MSCLFYLWQVGRLAISHRYQDRGKQFVAWVEEGQAFKLDADLGAPKGFIKPNIEGCFTIACWV